MSVKAYCPLTGERISKRYEDGRGTGYRGTYKPWITEADLSSEKGRRDRGACLISSIKKIALSAVESSARHNCGCAPRLSVTQFPLDREVAGAVACELGTPHLMGGYLFLFFGVDRPTARAWCAHQSHGNQVSCCAW